MKDNGILKYYRSGQFAKGGVLRLSQAGFLNMSDKSCKFNVFSYKTCDGKTTYFVKLPGFERETQAEVLLSQVYAKAGLKTAIYTPVIFGNDQDFGKDFALSRDVCEGDESVVLAQDFYDDKNLWYNEVLFSHNLSDRKSNVDERKYFAPSAVRDFALMQALDLGAYNTDRGVTNFFVKVGEDKRAESVISIDNGISMDRIARLGLVKSDINGEMPKGTWPLFWGSYFMEGVKHSREQLVEEFKTNEVVNEYISPHELAEKVGSLNIPEIALDIKETIGFDVGSDVAEAYDKSFYTLAEELEQ